MLFYHFRIQAPICFGFKVRAPTFQPRNHFKNTPASQPAPKGSEKTNHYPQYVNLKSEAPWLGKAVKKQPRMFMLKTDSFEVSADFKGFRVKGSTIKS